MKKELFNPTKRNLKTTACNILKEFYGFAPMPKDVTILEYSLTQTQRNSELIKYYRELSIVFEVNGGYEYYVASPTFISDLDGTEQIAVTINEVGKRN